jgi:hypothetical protein
MKRLFLLLMALIAAAVPCEAQGFDQCKSYSDAITRVVTGSADDADAAAGTLVTLEANLRCFAIFIAGDRQLNDSVFQQFVRRFEGSRTDKQANAAVGASSGTSVVSQGPAAKVLSAAVDYGGLTRAVDGQVITLRGNAAGLPAALVRKNVFPYCPPGIASNRFCVGSSILGVLRRVSFSVSFDTTRGTQVTGTPANLNSTAPAQAVVFTAQRNQISATSARIELWNRRDVSTQDFGQLWAAKVGAAMAMPSTDLLDNAGALSDAVIETPGYSAWQMRSKAAILAARPDRARVLTALTAALQEWLAEMRMVHPAVDALATDALAAYNRYFLAQDDLIASLARKNVLALEYTGDRPVGAVGTSNVRLIMDLPLTTRTKVVFNGAATFYNLLPANLPADVTRYRDAQVGVQLDHGLGNQSIVGPAMISLAVYYQYQHSPALLEFDPLTPIPGIEFTRLAPNAQTIFAEKGDIWLGQAKLSLTPPGSSIKVPLSLTYSNRTELIDKPTWRGQVGLAYDLDSLLGALK